MTCEHIINMALLAGIIHFVKGSTNLQEDLADPK